MDAGVEVYERQHAVLHAKTFTVDGHTSVVGSANLDTRSVEFNLELSAIIRNATFAAQMRDLFANDILYANRIDPDQWRSRPFRDRVVQWTVSRARYLL
jgi:cardiolipin synthase